MDNAASIINCNAEGSYRIEGLVEDKKNCKLVFDVSNIETEEAVETFLQSIIVSIQRNTVSETKII